MNEVVYKMSEKLFIFHCPGCEYGHHIDIERWTFNGDLVNPTVSPSLLVNPSNHPSQYRCHSFVKDGNIQFLSDCTHSLAGQTVPLPKWDDL